VVLKEKGQAGEAQSERSSVLSHTGAILGTILIPVPFLGTLIGACIGAGSGALVLELAGGKKMEDSIRYGIGAGLGEFLGITGKFIIGVIIWFFIAIAAFWP